MECYRKLATRELAYVGMIGSRRRIAGVRAELAEEGIPADALAKLHAPIGLDIGATTPDEIALSIIAQVVATRRAGKSPGPRSNGGAELDMAVLRELSGDGREARALVTIVGAKGSVPRGVGAKMVVWPDGRVLGSIGGGCSEGEALVIARDIIREGGYRVHRVDMTGAVAEDEGMACGGTMDVLIEAI
jgi:xanthine dehydrogenase accessory factor